ncbi:MAG: hypothetical protein NZ529_07735 [Cytophagaceae bacterium]|nr:hypothetical protein [Cytophagaceae bacterium]MDW8456676.1 hypothetical protein [Cytophagaceae bacterium]
MNDFIFYYSLAVSAISALYLIFDLVRFYLAKASTKWPSTEAIISEAALKSYGFWTKKKKPYIRYKYRINNKSYTSSTYSLYSDHLDKEEQDSFLSTYEKGKSITIKYWPLTPLISTIKTDTSKIFPIKIISIAVIALLFLSINYLAQNTDYIERYFTPEIYYYNKAVENYEKKNYTEAIKNIDKVLITQKNNADVYLFRAVLNDSLGNTKAAIDDLTQCINIAPDSIQYLFYRGNYYLKAKEYKKAIQDYDLYLKDTFDLDAVNNKKAALLLLSKDDSLTKKNSIQ